MKKVLRFIFGAIITLSMASCGGKSSSSYSSTSSYSQSSYKNIYDALEDGSIYYGMTYEQIKNVCGPANNLSRTNGVVEYAYYGAYDGVQLCFRNGRFDHWND